MKREIVKTINGIRANLTDDLLHPKYRDERHIRLSHTTGHCYIATEALYYSLTKQQQEIFRPCYLKINNITHWFLRRIEVGKEDVILTILDPTNDQFTGQLPYELGINGGFLTKTPSKRTIILMDRIKKWNRKKKK
jgi:hypothetical protein